MSADFAHTLGAITPEYAAAAGGEVEALDYLVHMANGHDYADGMRISIAEDTILYALTSTRATAADTVLAAARRLCCGDNPAPEHSARADHSQRMAFAEELARAVRGS